MLGAPLLHDAESSMPDNKTILQRANAAIATGDIEGFLSWCTDDLHWTAIGEEPIVGKDAVREWMRTAYAEPPVFKVLDMVAEGDLVVAIGEIDTKKADGTVSSAPYSDVWRFRDGRMAELRAFVVP